jgi:hypothetical protein
MVSCQNSLGVGIAVPPIINTVNGSSGSSARATGPDDSRVISVMDAPTNSAPKSARVVIAQLCPRIGVNAQDSPCWQHDCAKWT